VSDHRELVGRGACRIGDEFEPVLSGRPRDRRRVLNESAGEVVRRVMDFDALLHTAPANVEGNPRRHRRTILQGVHNIVVVLDLEIGDIQRGGCIFEVDMDAIGGEPNRPEQATLGDSGVEVVDLVRRVNLTLVDIQSNESECPPVATPVERDEGALHEAHVHVEEERGFLARLRICARPGAGDVGEADGAFEVGDG